MQDQFIEVKGVAVLPMKLKNVGKQDMLARTDRVEVIEADQSKQRSDRAVNIPIFESEFVSHQTFRKDVIIHGEHGRKFAQKNSGLRFADKLVIQFLSILSLIISKFLSE